MDTLEEAKNNSVLLIRNEWFIWTSKDNKEWGNLDRLLLHANSGIIFEEQSETEGSSREWNLLKEAVNNFRQTELSFITLWAKKGGTHSTEIGLHFRVHPKLCKSLKNILSEYKFKVTGEVSINLYNNGRTTKQCDWIKFSGELEEDYTGELHMEDDPFILNYALTKLEDSSDPNANKISLYFTYSVEIEWDYGYIAPLQLGQNNIVGKMLDCEDALKDLTIVVENGFQMKCHKLIFAAHSPVFAAMITSDMKESSSGIVSLPDISKNAIKLILPYLYGKEFFLNDLSFEVTLELFQFAHKYDLKELEEGLSRVFLTKKQDWFDSGPGGAMEELNAFVGNLEGYEELKNLFEKFAFQ